MKLTSRSAVGRRAILAAAAAGAPAAGARAQDPPDVEFVRRAFALRDRAAAAGDQPFGAVVVRGGVVVGESPSRVVVAGDPTAHAEIEAIRDAARRLGTRDLSGATLYGSSRACPMCEAAAAWARIVRLVHGADASDGGPPRLRC
jgi:tRNA(Arg) A34 adenosine deaminase TadA